MNRSRQHGVSLSLLLAVLVSTSVDAQGSGDAPLAAPAATPASDSKPASPPLKPEQLDALLAPIALYPDPLLAQVLMASTYPLEVVEAARWSKANPKVTGKALEDAMLKQSWDPSVKSLCSFPDTLAMMNEKLDWTQKLGDAFLADQDGAMEAVQRLRAKAQAAGNLKSSKELTVTTEKPTPPPTDGGTVVASATAPAQVIVIQPANPQVVYVPQYNPVVVYGTWPYPAYPPYPVYPPGYVAATAAISFGVGLAVGAAMWGSCSWGYHGHSSVNINVNNYNRYNHTNINTNNNNWNHNAAHRQGVPYQNSAAQQKYGQNRAAANTASREQFRGRADEGRQQIAQGGADNFRPSGGAGGGASAAQRPAGGAGGGASAAQRPAGGAGGGASAVQRPAGGAGGGASAAQRPAGGAGGGAMPSQRPGGGGGASAAQRPAGGSAYQGMNNGRQAQASSARGHSSMGGGGSRGGGGGRRR